MEDNLNDSGVTKTLSCENPEGDIGKYLLKEIEIMGIAI